MIREGLPRPRRIMRERKLKVFESTPLLSFKQEGKRKQLASWTAVLDLDIVA